MKLVSQTPITPGQPSTATIMGIDENGNTVQIKLVLPPGKDAQIPGDVVRKAALSEFVSGLISLNPNDAAGVGLHWDGTRQCPVMVYGSSDTDALYSRLLGSTQDGVYFTVDGNVVPRINARKKAFIQAFKAKGISNGTRITFPTAFAAPPDCILVNPYVPNVQGQWAASLFCPITGSEDKYSFTVGSYYSSSHTDGIANDLAIIAIGEAP